MKGTTHEYRGLRPSNGNVSRTLILMGVCGIILFAALIGQLYRVMILRHEELEGMAVGQQTRETSIAANRGGIYDRNGNALAVSATAYNVFLSPYELKRYEEDVNLIAETLPRLLEGYNCREPDQIRKMAEDTASWYKTLATRVDARAVDGVRAFLNAHDLKSIHIEETTKRYYPYGSLACHVIGFVGAENTGLSGLEAAYNELLSGKDGSVERLRTGRGDTLFTDNYEEHFDAVDGCSLNLTIDTGIQYLAEKYLRQGVADYNCKGGCCIVMDVKTGAIRAMASYNGFDPNAYQTLRQDVQERIDEIKDPEERSRARAEAQYAQWRNMAISDTYEPGSVFKIITLSMALETGAAGEHSRYGCGGTTRVKGRTTPLKCWKTAGHGLQTLTEAVQHSCNVAFVQIGAAVGAERFYDYIQAFGFFEKTGIDIGGEAVGSWWSPEVFTNPENLSQLAAASFGQTFTITPLQMVTAVSAAVNGGSLMRPYLVASAVSPDGATVYEAPGEPVRQVLSENSSRKVCEILEAVVSGAGGTGKNAYVPGYRIGGKTGTSEKVAHQAATGTKDYMVSFCGVAPMDNPELAILYILDSPDQSCGVYVSGGNMAAPAVGGLFSEILPYLGYTPHYTEKESRFVDVTVPSFTGGALEEAKKTAAELGLSVTVVGDGEQVTEQLPAAGSEVASGSCLVLYAGELPDQGSVEVPELVDLTVEEARDTLAGVGLYLDTTGASPLHENVVVSVQAVPPGTQADYGSVIRVTLVDASIQGDY